MNKTVIALMNEVEMALGSNYEVRCGEIEKEKNKKKIMIIVHEKENDDTTAFEVNQLVECIKNGRFSVKKAAEKLVEAYKIKETPEERKILLTREFVLENVTYKLINKQRNAKKLESVPHKDILDLAATYKVTYNAEDGRNIVIELDNETIETVNVSLDELDAAARKNTSKHGFIVMSMPHLGIASEEEETIMHVITNPECHEGVIAMLYKDCLAKVAEVYDDNVIILPSSIHEIIVMPETQVKTHLSDLKEIIFGVNNEDCIAEDEVLGDLPYRFDKTTGELSIIK